MGNNHKTFTSLINCLQDLYAELGNEINDTCRGMALPPSARAVHVPAQACGVTGNWVFDADEQRITHFKGELMINNTAVKFTITAANLEKTYA